MPDGALEGIRVIELGQAVSAPYCAKLFADFGADVVKVEPRGAGDLARQWGPFPQDQPDPEQAGLFFFLNTNKRGITLDVSVSRGRELLLGLLREADVLIENNRPQQMRAWGLDYASLSQKAAVLGFAAYVTRILLAHDEDHALRSLHHLLLRITRAREKKRTHRTFPRRSFRPRLRWGPSGRVGG